VLNADVDALLHVSVADLLVAATPLERDLDFFHKATYRMTPTADLVTL
jgi:hypothetical protein